MGIGFQTKSKSKKCTCGLNGCYHSTDKGLHCTKMKKRNLELYRKIPSSTNLLNHPRKSGVEGGQLYRRDKYGAPRQCLRWRTPVNVVVAINIVLFYSMFHLVPGSTGL